MHPERIPFQSHRCNLQTRRSLKAKVAARVAVERAREVRSVRFRMKRVTGRKSGMVKRKATMKSLRLKHLMIQLLSSGPSLGE